MNSQEIFVVQNLKFVKIDLIILFTEEIFLNFFRTTMFRSIKKKFDNKKQ